MTRERKAANAMGGKTARACESCLRKRARWFCAADDAFLCQSCDASVHSANQLASRHERVRLESASAKFSTTDSSINTHDSAPAWHRGFTRKARTPRHNSTNKSLLVQQKLKDKEKTILDPLLLVPEMGSEEEGNMVADESEDQLLYRVPVFDPFAAEFCDVITSSGRRDDQTAMGNDVGDMAVNVYGHEGTCTELDDMPSFLPSDVDLAEFAADVENLLGSGLDEETDVKDLGFLECKEEEEDEETRNLCSGDKEVKVKNEQEVLEAIPGFYVDQDYEMARESLDWNFDYESPFDVDIEEGGEEKVLVPLTDDQTTGLMVNSGCNKDIMKRNISLRLNYEAVITAWASQGCPWTTGSRPELNADDCWPDCMGTCPKGIHQPYGSLLGGALRMGGVGDGGREARVLRYKEKRRTRLFSKKIRYEVRKLNAEKRPRMKGRFVKRTTFMGSSTAFPNNYHHK